MIFKDSANVVEIDIRVKVAFHQCSILVVFDVFSESRLRKLKLRRESLLLEVLSGHVISICQEEKDAFVSELAL